MCLLLGLRGSDGDRRLDRFQDKFRLDNFRKQKYINLVVFVFLLYPDLWEKERSEVRISINKRGNI